MEEGKERKGKEEEKKEAYAGQGGGRWGGHKCLDCSYTTISNKMAKKAQKKRNRGEG